MPIVKFKPRLYTSEPLDNGKYPIVIQVSWRDHKPQIRRKRLNLSCFKNEWDRENHCLKDSAYAAVKKNAHIEDALVYAEQVYYELEEWDYRLWASIYSSTSNEITFTSFVKEKIKRYLQMDKAGTAIYYRECLHALQRFMNKQEIVFQEVNKPVLRRFEEDFIRRGFKGERTMRGIKTLFSKAVEEEVIPMKMMPFKTAYNPIGYKFSHLKKIRAKQTNRIKHLSDDQIEAIKNYQPPNESYQKAKDLWLFSYYTMGVNPKDIALLRKKDIRDGEWFFNRAKTSTGYNSTPLRKECIDIIDRYYDSNNKYIFSHILSEKYDKNDERIKKRLNCYLSNLRRRFIKMSKDMEFPGYITLYFARYSSGARALRRGVDIRALQQAYRHSSVTTTEGYEPKRIDEKIYEVL